MEGGSDSQLMELVQRIQYLHGKDKVADAYSLLEVVIDQYKINLDNFPVLLQVSENYMESRKILAEFEDTSDWITERSDNVKVSYKKIPGSPTISLQCESVIQVPLFNFICLLYETDFYPDWLPFCKKTATIQRISKSRKIIYSEFDVLKVAKRVACLEGYGLNLLDSDGVVLIISKSVNGYMKLAKTEARVNFFGCMIRPLSETQILVKTISNFDPNIMFLPYKVLNWIVRKIASTIFSKITQKSKETDNSEFIARMGLEENIEFYTHLQESLKEYLDSITE